MRDPILSAAVRRALAEVPASLNTIARAVRVHRSTLARVMAGKIGMSPKLARRLARVLEDWSRRYAASARRIEVALGSTR